MKYLPALIVTAVLAFALSMEANAATINTANFDFGEIAKNNEHGAASMSFTDNGITVTATAEHIDRSGRHTIYPYLDHDRNGNAGLGACKVLDRGAQCAPSSDDNVTFGEILTLTFDQEVSITDITFKNGKHGDKFDSSFGLSIDGGLPVRTPLANMSDVDLLGTSFAFINWDLRNKGDKTAQFYINDVSVSAVPLPAAAWLFITGLVGMVAFARRKA